MAKKRIAKGPTLTAGGIYGDEPKARYTSDELKVKRILSSRGRAVNDIAQLLPEEIAALAAHCDEFGTIGLDTPEAFAEVWIAVERRRKEARGRELPPAIEKADV